MATPTENRGVLKTIFDFLNSDAGGVVLFCGALLFVLCFTGTCGLLDLRMKQQHELDMARVKLQMGQPRSAQAPEQCPQHAGTSDATDTTDAGE